MLCTAGAVGGVDVRGAAPGTRETDVLRPGNLVEEVHAVLLTGGSAFGLDAAGGVMRFLEERGAGFAVGERRVPIVPAAVLFDLGLGWRGARTRPPATVPPVAPPPGGWPRVPWARARARRWPRAPARTGG